MQDLGGRSIIVTGGASGIGAATAEMLSADGACVTVADLSEELGASVVQRILAAGGQAQFARADVTDPSDVAAMIEKAENRYGALRGAVNAAGVPPVGKKLADLTLVDLDRSIAVNYRGVFICMQAQIRAMLRAGGGSIVVVASTAASMGFSYTGDYCGSKAGVMGLVRAAAADYATSGIRVNGVLPGPTQTPMLEGLLNGNKIAEELCKTTQAMHRIGAPQEVASAIRWLIDDLSGFTTGIGIPIDGGQVSVRAVSEAAEAA